MNETKLDDLFERAKSVNMTDQQKEVQRRSFAFGNTKIENELITKDMVDKIADRMEDEKNVK